MQLVQHELVQNQQLVQHELVQQDRRFGGHGNYVVQAYACLITGKPQWC